jgi:GcrA cell cycle regulator
MAGPRQLVQRPRRSAGKRRTVKLVQSSRAARSRGAWARQKPKESGGRIRGGGELGTIRCLAVGRRSARSPANWKATAAQRRRRARKRPSLAMQPPCTEGPWLWQQASVPDWVRQAKPYIEDPLVDAAVPMSQRRALLELEEGTCRWPIGDPSSADFRFCGATTEKGKPYCAAHWARAYRPRAQATSSAPVESEHLPIQARRTRRRTTAARRLSEAGR